MDISFDKIYVSWRTGVGQTRIMIGLIEERNSITTFTYLKEGVKEALKNGFLGYPGLDLNKTCHYINVKELFAKRIINLERNDSHELLDFWEIDSNKKNDRLYMLAMTQGKMQTDSFEFLAAFKPIPYLSFITEIAGIRYNGFDLSRLTKDDKLLFQKEPDNSYDKYAVKVLYDGDIVGYIKKGHNEIFHYENIENLSIRVKSITNTQKTKELYVRIYME